MVPHKIKMLLHNKTNVHKIEKAVHRMGKKSLPAIPLRRD
jgi:hypothetical protein